MTASKKISALLKERTTLSFEVFPPKPSDDADLSAIFSSIDALASAKPDFISVTYAAAGRNRARAVDIARFIKARDLVPLSHFTAVGYTRSDAEEVLALFRTEGIENILALRGDVPPGLEFPHSPWIDFHYARDLVAFLAADPGFCVGAACYPEGHPECRDEGLNVAYLREKAALGTNYFITQLFFDNDAFLRFRDRVRGSGIAVPIIAGIMPVYRASQIERILSLSGCSVPPDFRSILERYAGDPEGMERAGSDFAVAQIRNLVENGVDGVHLYTMNKSRQALAVAAESGLRA
jgi:methylenetetrahydrofolate reductase (NADPH)